MARKTSEELAELCNIFGVKILWSWSRYHCYKQDTWEYFLKYILHKKEDRTNSIYCVSGGNVHDIIEGLYTNKIKYEDMLGAYEDSLFTMNCAELKYNRSDSDKNEAIADKYENCIRHFFRNHLLIKFPHKVEHFITIKISDDIYMQAYVDMLYIEKNVEDGEEKNKVHIVDWKTSTRYQGKKIDDECGQLVLYAEGIRQSLAIPLEDIVCEWNFLKYVTVTYEQKNGKLKDRFIERNKIGESLVNTAKMWLKDAGYDEIDKYIDEMVLNNNIDSLPKEVREKFVIKDCYVQVPLSEEKISNLKNDIVTTVSEINLKTEEYEKTNDENIFWQDVTDADEFRLATLSGYSRKLHKPYDAYLKEKELFNKQEDESDIDTTEEDDLLAFVNSL
ncbi:PD-(D/E)XK nuclease family protein [Enterocloster bolteae]|uniref:PD-(D/E)XK nuclease family protein n=1 Tax=Enterocloster bolteae TaxID=208479 RepID=UPI002A80A068|nr:PD-(D/E)XK nuclease family protein [Enterocloster bolteae]